MILKTKRLVLRPPRKEDWKDLVEGCNDIETSKYVSTMPYPYKKKDAVSWIKKCQNKWRKKEKDDYPFFIELKKEKKVIGAISITNIKKQDKKCETGSWLNKKYRRKAYMSEAKIAVNEFVFNKLRLRKMETSVLSFNKVSRATQGGVGYKYEGTRKKSVISLVTGKIHDKVLYGLLKEDWKKNLLKLKRKLANKINKLEGNKD
jgi:RimJ/RimL family protein N-acetyltransferase